ncbi:MAG: bifunctional 5,10-methylenetetrahydrofolate dehydrogenase/5,10-methenyltetrahydrofolate cyclohydrolase [Bacteroidetes bacterium]|nr:bifunctional 5,10-methylenetetrahydrofolate dehydrogenase/5,10-methenyltetrahydrofolate cyclohydrolase [Bacteroidota bacterium]
MPLILDGKAAAAAIRERLQQEVQMLAGQGHRPPHLAAILVGNDGASETYVFAKKKACDAAGFFSSVIRLPEEISEEALLAEIHSINHNPDIDGLIVQLPLPAHISEQAVMDAITPEKDVDGFHDRNIGKLAKGNPDFIPATPLGILLLLQHYGIDPEGKHCVVLGRSNIVGRPLSILLSLPGKNGNATVTLCHSKTQNLYRHTKNADILIAALGRPRFVGADMVKPGVVMVDVGITRVDAPELKSGYRLHGDVDFEAVSPLCEAITPVPGGVGPMTIAGLLMNTMKARRLQLQLQSHIA